MKNKLLIVATTLAVALCSAASAQPRDGGRGAGSGAAAMPDIAEKLSLDDQQTKAWEAIRAEMEKSTESTRARLRELRQEGAGPDNEEVVKARGEMRKAFEKAEGGLMDILTDEQKAQYKELKKQAQANRGRRGHGGQDRGGSGGGRDF